MKYNESMNPIEGEMKNIERKEFEGNLLITISDNEVRIWVCNQQGINVFRFKALGKVYKSGNDVTVLTKGGDGK